MKIILGADQHDTQILLSNGQDLARLERVKSVSLYVDIKGYKVTLEIDARGVEVEGIGGSTVEIRELLDGEKQL